MTYERDNIRRMSGYVPGEQPDDASVVKLNTNESPYPPSEAVMAALRSIEAEALRRYPDPTAQTFRATAAEVHGVSPENIVATNAGDELLRLAITTFVDPGEPVGTLDPSYSLYPVLANVHGSPCVSIALLESWVPPTDLAKRWNEAGARVGFLVNPHAPSGTLCPVPTLDALAEHFDGVLVIDEAYVDFVNPDLAHDAVSLIARHDNVLILRTLSKGYALAGLRFGYGIGSPTLIEPMLTKTRDSYNTDAVSQRVAEAALRDRDGAASTWRAVRVERSRLAAELNGLGLPCAPSETNFVLATVPEGRGGGARALCESLKAQKIFVRYFDQERLDDKLRITVGTPQQSDRLLEALQTLLRNG